MSRIASTLADGDSMLLPERVSRPKFGDSPDYQRGLKRTSLRDSWKRKFLAMPKALREKARQSSLKRSPLKRASKGLKAEQSKYWKLSAAFLARPANKFCIICVVRREHGENILVNLATEIHHWAGRIKRLLCYIPFFKPSCRSCRDWPHDNKVKAREWGLLAPITQWNVCPDDERK